MHTYRPLQSPSPQGRGGVMSTYRADYNPPPERPLQLFSLYPKASLTTQQKMTDMWAQYQRHCYQTTSGARNPSSTFAQKGTAVMTTLLEKERENGAKAPPALAEKPPAVEKGPTQTDTRCPSSGSGEGRRAGAPSPGQKQPPPSPTLTSIQISAPLRPVPARREAWSQATGDAAQATPTAREDAGLERQAGKLPNIDSGEGSDEEAQPQGEGPRAEQFRRDMCHSARLEGQINRRIACQSMLMHLGLPFEGVTTYSQSYTHRDSRPTPRGPHRILSETAENWRPWSSEYVERYNGAERYVPGKRKPPSGLEHRPPGPSASQPNFRSADQARKHLRSEYQRNYSQRNYPGLARPKTSPAYAQRHDN